MISEISDGGVYKSRTGIHFKVLYRAKHAQDCSISMIVYTNLSDTFDSKRGTIWVISETLFLKMFSELE